MVRRTGRILFHKTAEMTIAEECPVSSSRARLNGFELQLQTDYLDEGRFWPRGPPGPQEARCRTWRLRPKTAFSAFRPFTGSILKVAFGIETGPTDCIFDLRRGRVKPGREGATSRRHQPLPDTRDRGFTAQVRLAYSARLSRRRNGDCRASTKYQIARHLTRAASPGKIPLHGEAQRLRSVRRGGDRRADSHGRNHGGRCLSPLRRVGRAALRPRDVRPKAEPRKNESRPVVAVNRRGATSRVVRRP